MGAIGMTLPLVMCAPEPTPEEAVREVIRQTALACEERRLGDAIAAISETYRDEDGLGKQQLYGLLFREFARDGGLGVALGPIRVEIEGPEATAYFVAALGESSGIMGLPDEVDALEFQVALALEDSNWMITWHSRAPVFRR